MGLWRAPLGPAERLHLLLHGCHYLLALPVVALHALLALWAAPLLADGPLLGALAGSLLLSLLLAGTQRSGRWPARAADLLALLAWTTPLALIAMNLALAALYGDWARAVPPLPGPIQVLGLAGLVAPLVVLLVGLAGYGRLSLGSALAVTLSYPLALYLDVAGVLLGLGDVMARRQLWLVVARAQRAQRAPAAGMHALRAWRAAGLRPWRTLPALLTAGVFCCGLLAAPEQELLVEPTACRALAHDGEPWIVPAARLADYCDPAPDGPARISTRHGRFTLRRADGLVTVDPTYWVRQDTTFACNLARFDPGEVLPLAGGGQELRVRRAPALPAPDAAAPPQPGLPAANESFGAEPGTDKPFRAGSLASKDEPAARFTYGRFEVELKAAAGAGLLTAFFLYRFDPWQEIDAEILGQDTTRLLANVYYNPGQEGDRYNYGYRGTPVLLELGFDAASDFHHYAIEWDPEEIRWFVDGRLLHHRPAGRPTPIPHLPMRLYLSAWPICSEELAGRLDERALPASAQVRAVRISSYERAESGWQDLLLGGCAGTPDPGGADWRHGAAWMQPGTAPER